MTGSADDFDTKKAEVFEALSHPVRVKILMALEASPLSFSQLKHMTQMGSSGQMVFHLSKLAGLVKTTENGNYVLSAEGIEAVRFLSTMFTEGGPFLRIPRRDTIVRVLLVSLLVMGITFLAVGLFLNSQTDYQNYNLSGFCCNKTIPPGQTYLGSGQYVVSQPEIVLAEFIAQPFNSGLQFEVVLLPVPYSGSCGLCSTLPANSTVIGPEPASTALTPSQAPPSGSAIGFSFPSSYYAMEAFTNPTTQNITLQSYIIEWQSPIGHPYVQIGGQLVDWGALLLIIGGLGTILYSSPAKRVTVPMGNYARDWYRNQKTKRAD